MYKDLKVELTLKDGLYLKIEVPENFFEVNTKVHSTKTLGKTRISDAIFDLSDGNMFTLDTDIFGRKRSDVPTVGAIEDLQIGKNSIIILA